MASDQIFRDIVPGTQDDYRGAQKNWASLRAGQSVATSLGLLPSIGTSPPLPTGVKFNIFDAKIEQILGHTAQDISDT